MDTITLVVNSPYTLLFGAFFTGTCGGLLFGYLVGESERGGMV